MKKFVIPVVSGALQQHHKNDMDRKLHSVFSRLLSNESVYKRLYTDKELSILLER